MLNNLINKLTKSDSSFAELFRTYIVGAFNLIFGLFLNYIFQFFKKLLLFHGIDTKDDKRISSLLGVNPYFLSQYSAASKLYSMKDCSNAIDVIYKADIKSKGINGNNDGQKEILIDLLNDLF